MIVSVSLIAAASNLHADIYRWDTGEVIPGTEGIEPGPGVDLSHMDLEYADLSLGDLTGVNFEAANLANASLRSSTLTGANLIDVDLTSAYLALSELSTQISRGLISPVLGSMTQRWLMLP